MTATLANDGERLQPRIVKRVGNQSLSTQPSVDGEHPATQMSAADLQLIKDAMRAVIEHPRGTAYAVGRGLNYTMAGKTGTAQVVAIAQGAEYDESKLSEFERDHALFIAFAPVEQPQIAIAVVLENGGSGSAAAAPIARGVLDAYFALEANNTEQVALVTASGQP